jgi:hypothetical protein
MDWLKQPARGTAKIGFSVGLPKFYAASFIPRVRSRGLLNTLGNRLRADSLIRP